MAIFRGEQEHAPLDEGDILDTPTRNIKSGKGRKIGALIAGGAVLISGTVFATRDSDDAEPAGRVPIATDLEDETFAPPLDEAEISIPLAEPINVDVQPTDTSDAIVNPSASQAERYGEVATLEEAIDQSGYPIHPVAIEGYSGAELMQRMTNNIAWVYNVGDGDPAKLSYAINDVLEADNQWHTDMVDSIQPGTTQTLRYRQYPFEDDDVKIAQTSDGFTMTANVEYYGILKELLDGDREGYVYDHEKGVLNNSTNQVYFELTIALNEDGSVTDFIPIER